MSRVRRTHEAGAQRGPEEASRFLVLRQCPVRGRENEWAIRGWLTETRDRTIHMALITQLGPPSPIRAIPVPHLQHPRSAVRENKRLREITHPRLASFVTIGQRDVEGTRIHVPSTPSANRHSKPRRPPRRAPRTGPGTRTSTPSASPAAVQPGRDAGRYVIWTVIGVNDGQPVTPEQEESRILPLA